MFPRDHELDGVTAKATTEIASLPDKASRNLALARIIIGAMKLPPDGGWRAADGGDDRPRDGTDRPGDQRPDRTRRDA